MADLNALIAQGAQFNLPNPVDQYSKVMQLQQMGQANQLNKLKMDEYTRGVAEQNAMRGVMAQPGFDANNPAHQAALLQAAPSTAPTLLEKLAQVKKEQAQTEHFGAQSSKLKYDVESQKLTQGLNEISNMPDINAAFASVDSHVADGSLTAEKANQLKAQIKAAPDFQTWQKQTVTGMLAAKDRLDAMANQRFLNPPSAVAAPAAPQSFVTKDSSGRARYIVNGVEVSPEDYRAAQAGVVAQPVRSFGAPESTTITSPIAQPDVMNALALKIQGLEAQRNALRPNLDSSIAQKQFDALGKQIEDLSKGFSVAPGAAHFVPGVGTVERAFQPRLLTPEEEAQKLRLAKAGATNVQTNVNAFTPASEEAQRDFIRSTRTTYDTLKNAPGTLKNIEEAIKLIPSAKGFMGPGGESLLDAASFLNNRLGTNINTKGITDATELRSRLFQGIIENLRKLDANPTENQQNAMRVALGNIGTDPNALPAVLNSFADTVRSKVETHNAEVEGAVSRGVKFPYDPTIKLPTPSAVTTAPAAARPAGVPAEWKLHVDAQGRKAYVSPNGKDFKEVP